MGANILPAVNLLHGTEEARNILYKIILKNEHPLYDGFRYDFALLELDNLVEFTPTVIHESQQHIFGHYCILGVTKSGRCMY